MRSYIDFGPGVVSISAEGSGSSTDDTYVTPPLEQVADVADFSALDIEFRLLSVGITGTISGDMVRLHLETSMQNTDDDPAYWSPYGVGEELDLAALSAPFVTGMTLSSDLLRYFRWRISIPGHSSGGPVVVKAVLQLRGFGRAA